MNETGYTIERDQGVNENGRGARVTHAETGIHIDDHSASVFSLNRERALGRCTSIVDGERETAPPYISPDGWGRDDFLKEHSRRMEFGKRLIQEWVDQPYKNIDRMTRALHPLGLYVYFEEQKCRKPLVHIGVIGNSLI